MYICPNCKYVVLCCQTLCPRCGTKMEVYVKASINKPVRKHYTYDKERKK